MRGRLLLGAILGIALLTTSRPHQEALAQESIGGRSSTVQRQRLSVPRAATPGQGQWREKASDSPKSVAAPSTDRLAADPFKYRAPPGSEGFLPADVEMPKGIRVLGILMMSSGHSLAALQIPSEEEVFYVAEGDDLPISAAEQSSSVRQARTAPSKGGSTSALVPQTAPGLIYLRIKSISPQHVEVYPEHSPTNVQILR